MHGRGAAARVRAGFEQVAVVVPFDVVHIAFAEHGADLFKHVREGVRIRQIEHLLVAMRQRQATGGLQHPVGVLAVQVGVGVDHLRFEPQTELHPVVVNGVGERLQAVRPDAAVDPPVAQSGGVRAAGMEPAVVEHEPLDPQTRGPADQVQHHVGVLIEVQRLPHVQRHRLAGRVRRQRTFPGVQTVRHAVQAVVAGGDHDPRRRVRVAGGQDHLARLQQLTGEHRGSVLGDAVDGQHRVAAPRRLHAEHGTGAEAEAFGARNQRGAIGCIDASVIR